MEHRHQPGCLKFMLVIVGESSGITSCNFAACRFHDPEASLANCDNRHTAKTPEYLSIAHARSVPESLPGVAPNRNRANSSL